MDYPLAQTGIELAVFNGALAIAVLSRGAGMDEDQVQIGTVPQLQTAQFPVGNDSETLGTRGVVNAGRWFSMSPGEVIPAKVDDLLEYDFSQVRQMVADFHEGQDFGNYLSQDIIG